MIKKIVNIIAFLFLIQLNVFSQSSEDLFRYADSIKSIKGEESAEFLDALSIAIQTANNEGYVNKAYENRKYHSNIVAKKYGEYSKEYANDMFRLGNVATRLNYIDSANYYYTKCIEINENITNVDTIAYLNSITLLANNYYDQGISNPTKDFSNPDYKLNLAEKLFEDLFYKIDEYKVGTLWKMYNVDALWNKVNAKHSIGYIQFLKNNFETAIENFTYAADNALLAQDTMMYVNANWGLYLSYDGLYSIYQERDYTVAHECLNKTIYHYELVYYDKNINDKYKQSFSYNDLSILYSLLSINYAEYNADYYNAILYCQKSAELLLLNEGEKSERYLSEMIELMRLYSTINNYSESLKISEHIYDKIVYASKDDILSYLNTSMSIYANTGQLEEFDKASKEYAEYVGAFFANDPSEIVGCIINISLCYITLNKTEDAVNLIDGCIDFVNNQNDVDNTYLAILYALKGSAVKFTNMNEALSQLDKALDILCADKNYNLILSTMREKGFIQHEYGQMKEALNIFHRCLEICKTAGFDNYNNAEYMKVLNNISVCNIGMGNYAEAISLLDEAKKSIEDIYGKNNISYIMTITNIIYYYASIGDYTNVIKESIEAIDVANQTYGTDINQWTFILKNNLSFAYMNIGDYEKTKETALSCEETIKSLCGESSEKLSSVYLNCALASYFSGDDIIVCKEYFDKSIEILLQNNLTDTRRFVGVIISFAKLLLMENFTEAESIYEEAISFLKSDNSLDVTTLAEYYHSKIIASAKIDTLSIDFINKKLEQFYLDEMIMMTDSERNTYLSKRMNIEYINNAILSIGLDNKHNDDLYDFVLKTKGIQLQTANEINNIINSSGNEELIRDWDKLKHIKMALLRNDSKELRQQADDLERSVLQQSKELSEYTELFKTGWVEVRDALSKNDVAIEFVSYINLKSTDTIYGAFVLRNDWKNPKYIELCNNSEIREIIKNNPSKLYSKELSNKLYKHIWEPLEKHMNKNENVYFSPSGAIHTLSLESLYDNEGIMLEEKYNMYRTSTTKNICIKQETPSYKSAAIYGGLRYDIDSLQYIKENTYTEDSTIRAGWKYLYGTKKESDTIAQMMSESGVETKLYQEYYGDEASFKNLSGNDIDIMHIATHGYFLNNETSYKDFIMKEIIRNINENQYMIRDNDNPLYRSGLMMSGCNGSWQNKEQFNDNKEDGVLTSAEISFLDFSNTDLVVLSACETALGNVTMDGVWGLQRAFKNAGVNTIIMSLWKVDDEATSYFMVNFYKQLLGGSSKRDAFNTAKKLTREKYEDPYYWSAFIMLD